MAVKKKNKSAEADFPFYIKRFWQIFGIGFGIVVLIFLLASWGALGHMPSFNDLENPESNLATEIISSDGETIGKFYKNNYFIGYLTNYFKIFRELILVILLPLNMMEYFLLKKKMLKNI